MELMTIGKPIFNTSVYVLDAQLNVIPVGVVGELYIGGVGVARGYLNQEELTKKRFIDNPFGQGRLYRTGDLVRYLPDGRLEYFGRNDFQFKIRGFRIELAEIEMVICRYTGIQQAVLMYYEASQGYLVAYYVSKEPIDESLLEAYLLTYLPEYMIPNRFIHMDALPLTTNGKLNRKALVKPEYKNQRKIAPTTQREIAVVRIWEEALDIEGIGLDDDFFKLGGDSITSIRLVAKMKIEGFNISVKELIKNKTIFNLLKHVNSEGSLVCSHYETYSLIDSATRTMILHI
jgi:aryl carrier-like protein